MTVGSLVDPDGRTVWSSGNCFCEYMEMLAGLNRRRVALLVLAIIVAIVCLLRHLLVASEPTHISVRGMQPGEAYRWKVVTETADGLINESETYVFEVNE